VSDIAEVLKTRPKTDQPHETVTLVTMIRPSNTGDKFEMALGVTGRWLELPVSQVRSAREIGVYELGDERFKVAELVIERPKTDSVWFDFLAHVLQELSHSLSSMENGCGCTDGNTSQLPSVRYRLGFRNLTWRLACLYNGYTIRWCAENGM
jgi:hypothetical protein